MLKWAAAITCLVLVTLPVWSAQYVNEDMDAVASNPLSLDVPGRALSQWSTQAQRALGGGPRALHLGNLALHAIAGVLVWRLAQQVSRVAWAPWIALVVFWTHPLQVEPVAYVAARPDLLAAVCLLLAILATMRRQRAWVIGAWLVLAAMSKEIAVVGLALVTLTAAVWSGPPRLAWRRWLLAAIGMTAVVWAWPWSGRSVGFVTEAIPIEAHVTSQAVALWSYLWTFMTFQGLTVDHGIVHRIDGASALAAVSLVAAGLSAWWWRRQWPMGAWGVAWIAIWIGPRFLLDAPELVSERHLYLAMVAMSIVTGDLAARLIPASWEDRCRA